MNKFDEYKKEIEANHKEYMTLCVDDDVFLQNGKHQKAILGLIIGVLCQEIMNLLWNAVVVAK